MILTAKKPTILAINFGSKTSSVTETNKSVVKTIDLSKPMKYARITGEIILAILCTGKEYDGL